MADVFVSYAREDLERVRPIVGAIEDAGYSVFWDRRIPPGTTWRQYIGKALDEAKCVIVVWSQYAIESDWVMEEADDGRQRRILLPIAIDDGVPPLGFRSIHDEDFREWQGDGGQTAVKGLLKSIEGITGNTARERPAVETVHEEAPPPREPSFTKPDREDQGPTRKRQASVFLKLGPRVVSMSFAVWVLAVGIHFWFGEEKTGTGYLDVKREDVEKADQAIGDLSGLPESVSNGLVMEFVLVPPGTFMMGSDNPPEARPVHQVAIDKAFYLQATEVTQRQWVMVMGDNPSHFKVCDRCPVENVTWNEVKDFVARVDEMGEGDYRLPSEAQWEYAARSGGHNQTYAGGENLDELGWCIGNSNGATHPVGHRKPNALGLYDMSGYVSEYVEDDWHESYRGAPEDGKPWVDVPRGDRRVIRGGNWDSYPQFCSSTFRNKTQPFFGYPGHGFRLAKSIDR